MNSKEITEATLDMAIGAKRIREQLKRVRIVDEEVLESMDVVITEFQQATIEILEQFDSEEGVKGFRRPSRKPEPGPLYDTLEEKRQALEGP